MPQYYSAHDRGSGVLWWAGKLFHGRGPATAKLLLSPNVVGLHDYATRRRDCIATKNGLNVFESLMLKLSAHEKLKQIEPL